MLISKFGIAILFLWIGVSSIYAQENRTEICVDFRVNETHVDASFSDNAVRMQELISFLKDIRRDSTVRIVDVSFCGAASPEGSYQLNRKLAQGRLSALEKLVRQEVEIPDSIITRNDSYIPWDYLKSQIESSNLSFKGEVLGILSEKPRLVDYNRLNGQVDYRIVRLQKLDGGKVWQQINRLFFSNMRNACMVLVTYRSIPQPELISDIVSDPVVVEPELMTMESEPVVELVPDTMMAFVEMPSQVVSEPEGWTRQLHVKTNVIGLGMGIANVAVEVDVCKHLSFSLPVYYSAWDYFKPTLKFRTFTVQPEVRYWFNSHNEGWFLGTHFGYGYYNIALDDEYRIQDHNRETPSIGGGLSMGYRTHLSKNKRWKMEFSIGGGVYDSHYDKFRNEENGFLVSTEKKTWYGVDQATISFVYSFNLSRKGGVR